MNKLLVFVCFVFLFSCHEKMEKGSFVVNGKLKNAPDQNVYLEQIYFNQQPPHVIDTSEMKNGTFKVKAVAAEEGLYRIRFEKNPGYLFINDRDDIDFDADANDSTLQSTRFNTPSNSSLSKFIILLDSLHTTLMSEAKNVKDLQDENQDSLVTLARGQFDQTDEWYKSFLRKYIDTTQSPIIAVFALSYGQDLGIDTVKQMLVGLTKRFPKSTPVADVVKQLDQMTAAPAPTQPGQLSIGQMAPDFTLPDTSGKPFTLSSLRGKYVLLDFWASWCGPCREENPNVVATYKLFKEKNFAILGVSLDKEKSSWLKAIHEDGLAWKQVSDLKYWSSEAAALYNVEGIPYNVLLDPGGKIIAIELRGADLRNKLKSVLN